MVNISFSKAVDEQKVEIRQQKIAEEHFFQIPEPIIRPTSKRSDKTPINS